MTSLGDLPGGRSNSLATAVSASGNEIVGFGLSTNTINETEAFSWNTVTGMTRLVEALPQGTINVSAQGISATGQVVVGVLDMSDRREAFRWSSPSGLVGLGDFDGGTFNSTAYAASADGSVIVGDGRSAIGIEAFRWTQETGLTPLGHLPGLGVFSSTAFDVSADGNVVVGYSTSSDGIQAFRWTAADGMVGLGYISPTDEDSVAEAVSANGKTVVGYSSSEQGRSAFVWIRSQGMKSLWELLLNHGIDPAQEGWTSLDVASDVSAEGRYVVGKGKRDGRDEAYIADLAPVLTAATSNGETHLRWPAGFRLQHTTTFGSNAWEEVTSAASPWRVPAEGIRGFFRLIEAP
jgi:probable HAF family extracellular repeat protein